MRYVRLLTNALAAGTLLATYLTVLLLQLNPQVSALSATSLRWAGVLAGLYVPYVSVGLFFALLAGEVMTGRLLRPAWLSVRLLVWASTGVAVIAAAVTWANLTAFGPVLSDGARIRMRDGAWLLSGCAAAMGAMAIARYSFGRRGSRPVALAMAAVGVVSIAGPLWLRGPRDTPVRPPIRWLPPAPVVGASRVRVLLFEGASLGFIRQRVAAGQLSNLGRLLDRGAVIDLATIRPTEVAPVWAAAATGKVAPATGVRSNSLYSVTDADTETVDVLPDYCFAYALVSQRFVRVTEPTSRSLAARPVWDVLADYRVPVGIVNWPLTAPATLDGPGFVLSDRFDETAASPFRLDQAAAGSPTTAVDVARGHFDRWQARPWHEVLTTFSRGEVEPVEVNRARWDRAFSDTARELDAQFGPRLTAVRYEGLEAFGHEYLRQAQPELFGDPRWAGFVRPILDRYYGYLDGEVARATKALLPGDLLLVVSGFGMDPTPLVKRAVDRLLGFRPTTGSHEAGPDGFLLAYGLHVAPGQFPRGSIADLAPTVLYYFGVPVARDMDGFARTDLFLPSFTSVQPVKYVASHERPPRRSE